MSTIKKTLRLPDDLVEFIEGLPRVEGEDFSSRLMRLLRIGKAAFEREAASKTDDQDSHKKENKRAANN